MFERRIGRDEVRNVLDQGEVIEAYPEDRPFPSQLVPGWDGLRPVHVVSARNEEEDETIVITVYEPEPDRWEPDFKRRRKP